jgi:hypothetical protein
VFCPPSFVGRTVTGILEIDRLEEQRLDNILLQRDGAPPDFRRDVTGFLSRKLPEKLIGRGQGLFLGTVFALSDFPQFIRLAVHQGCCVRATVGNGRLRSPH